MLQCGGLTLPIPQSLYPCLLKGEVKGPRGPLQGGWGHQAAGSGSEHSGWGAPCRWGTVVGEQAGILSPQIFTRMGQCYTFNSGANGAELLTTPQSGAGNGLEVMLDVQQDEYLPVWKDTGTAQAVALQR